MRKIFGLIIVCAAIMASCRTQKSSSVYFLSPEEGSRVTQGHDITVKLDAGADSFDSVRYLLDTSVVATKKDTAAVMVPTADLSLGIKILTAQVYQNGEYREITTNVVVLSPKPPVQYSYTVVNTYPHDASAFTEGLEYHDGYLYESTGLNGESSLRKVELKTGKVVQKTDLDEKYFGEGMTIVGDKIIQITYREGVGFVYDKNTFEKLSEFPYQAGREGWGLYFDGKRILNTDGTNTIHFLNKDTYVKEGSIDVYNNRGPVDSLNELEVIDGKIFANIWQKNIIVIIDPETGAVEGELNLTDLYPEDRRNPDADVLNGIAWDAAGKRLFVTGKKWDKVFEIKVVSNKL